jgi:hypothetical protein
MTTDSPSQPAAPLDIVWPTDNPLEIPTLRFDRQASVIVAPMACWGTVRRRDQRNVNSWHFYTDDYRFARLWTHPQDVVATGAKVCVEPNFSALDSMPFPVGWNNLYRKRWVARWWQDQGIEIIADLYVGAKYQAHNWMGIPKGWRAYATRGSAEDPESIVSLFYRASEHAGTDQILYYVYGGGITQARVLRDAKIPVVLSDYYRDHDASWWLATKGSSDPVPQLTLLAD